MKSLLASMQLQKLRASRAARKLGPLLFMREVLANPASAGAPCPSWRQLARKMADAVPENGQGLIVEVGAGTGVVTQALLERGIAPDRLLVIERSPRLFAHLCHRFPHVRVLLGDASLLGSMLPDGASIDALVSGVPLRSLPFEQSELIVAHWRHVLPPGSVLIQFTYALYGPLRHLSEGFVHSTSEIAWLNFPPARVVSLKVV
jgi:phosphatidylethanolamine/phosphatidyl-N-methylethanolamine N-methyltransferase